MAKNCNIITIEILSDYYNDDKKNDFQKWRQQQDDDDENHRIKRLRNLAKASAA